jgi:hypothetical protein
VLFLLCGNGAVTAETAAAVAITLWRPPYPGPGLLQEGTEKWRDTRQDTVGAVVGRAAGAVTASYSQMILVGCAVTGWLAGKAG